MLRKLSAVARAALGEDRPCCFSKRMGAGRGVCDVASNLEPRDFILLSDPPDSSTGALTQKERKDT